MDFMVAHIMTNVIKKERHLLSLSPLKVRSLEDILMYLGIQKMVVIKKAKEILLYSL
jgi:hypothetical protein